MVGSSGRRGRSNFTAIEECGAMFTYAVVFLCLSQILFVAKRWMRVTARDRDASKLRRMRKSVDWRGPGHRPRVAAGVAHFGELRGR
jgi:hypothetical protein